MEVAILLKIKKGKGIQSTYTIKIMRSTLESSSGENGAKVLAWKAKYLSLEGRITLIQSTLGNLPMYFMSLFKCPMSMINHLKRLQQNFLWQGKHDKKNFHRVDWKFVCKPKKERGPRDSIFEANESSVVRQMEMEVG